MVNQKNSTKFWNQTWFWGGIFMLMIVGFGLLFFTKFDFSFGAGDTYNMLPGVASGSIPSAVKDDCSDYNLAYEYSKIFNMDDAEDVCEEGGIGLWTATYDEVSCEALVPSTLDCSDFEASPNGEIFIKYCEDYLLADFVCHDAWYVGCVCDKVIEDDFDEEPTEESNCGDGIDNDNDGYIDCDDSDCNCEFCNDKWTNYGELGHSESQAIAFCHDKTLCYTGECQPFLFIGLAYDRIDCECGEEPLCFEMNKEYFVGSCVCPRLYEQVWLSKSSFKCELEVN